MENLRRRDRWTYSLGEILNGDEGFGLVGSGLVAARLAAADCGSRVFIPAFPATNARWTEIRTMRSKFVRMIRLVWYLPDYNYALSHTHGPKSYVRRDHVLGVYRDEHSAPGDAFLPSIFEGDDLLNFPKLSDEGQFTSGRILHLFISRHCVSLVFEALDPLHPWFSVVLQHALYSSQRT